LHLGGFFYLPGVHGQVPNGIHAFSGMLGDFCASYVVQINHTTCVAYPVNFIKVYLAI